MNGDLEDEPPLLGPQLRVMRRAKGWTQVRLARLMAVDPATIQNWEVGRRGISVHVARLLRQVFLKYPAGKKRS